MELFSVKEVILLECRKIWIYYLFIFLLTAIALFLLLKNNLFILILTTIIKSFKTDQLNSFASFYYVLILLIPFLVFITTHNVMPQAINSKYVRFMISRMERSSFIIGLVLSHTFMFMLGLLLWIVYFTFLMYLKNVPDILLMSIAFFFFFCMYAFSLISLSFMISFFIRKFSLFFIICGFIMHIIIFGFTQDTPVSAISLFYFVSKSLSLTSLTISGSILLIHGIAYTMIKIIFFRVMDV
jgi:hypothetical protein